MMEEHNQKQLKHFSGSKTAKVLQFEYFLDKLVKKIWTSWKFVLPFKHKIVKIYIAVSILWENYVQNNTYNKITQINSENIPPAGIGPIGQLISLPLEKRF